MTATAVGGLGSLLLPGGSALSLGLYYLSSACFLLIWACAWRRPLSFLRLALASIVAFPVSVFLHNALEWALPVRLARHRAPVPVAIKLGDHPLQAG